MSVGVAAPADAQSTIAALAGTWTLAAADLLHPDGTRTPDYGAAPKGRLIIDASGRYSLQIFKAERARFASDDKVKGTPAEFESAVLGSSTHFGTMSVDPLAHVLTVNIEGASFPNQEGTQQKRHYTLVGDELSYNVPPRSDGNTPISVWRRVRTDALLTGTYGLVSVDDISPDGTRVPLFGGSPQGLLILDGSGHYSMQVFRGDRSKFARNDRNKGKSEENQSAVKGASTHFGTYAVNESEHVMTFTPNRASYPDREGRDRPCQFTLAGNEFTLQSSSSGSTMKREMAWRRISP